MEPMPPYFEILIPIFYWIWKEICKQVIPCGTNGDLGVTSGIPPGNKTFFLLTGQFSRRQQFLFATYCRRNKVLKPLWTMTLVTCLYYTIPAMENI